MASVACELAEAAEAATPTRRSPRARCIATSALGFGLSALLLGVLAVVVPRPARPRTSEQPVLEATKSVNCLGFDRCPDFPKPYGPTGYPEEYTYSGTFPAGFIWGLGTAAYQVEGAYREGGRGASIWDTFTGADTVDMPGANCSYCCKKAPCPINEAMFDKGATGNVATDHYHMWRTDIALMKSMGLTHYRFSISWPRLVPTGRVEDGVNEQAKAFYNSLIDGLLQEGITPVVTLYHWDLPQGLLDPPRVEGWWARDPITQQPNGQILKDFVAYVNVCFSEFGDRVKTWVTFNEAWTFTFLASGGGKAPGLPEFGNGTVDPYIAGHNVLNAHAAAVHLYRTTYKPRQGGIIGITNNMDWREPKTADPQDVAAAERAVEFQLGWFTDPIFGGHGDYPPAMRRLYGDRLPKFTDEERRLVNGSSDFFGLNHYGTAWAEYDPTEPGGDTAYAKLSEDGLPRGQSIWLYGAGWGLRKLLNWVAKRYNSPPIIVTESGWSVAADNATAGARDRGRLFYFANYTSEMRKAIYEDGVDVRGYFAWSLVDNFEWERGFQERFGAVFNDYQFGLDKNAPTRQTSQPTPGRQVRTRKDSSCWLEAVWKRNALVDPNSFAGCARATELAGSYATSSPPGCPRRVVLLGPDRGQVTGANPAAGASRCDGRADVPWGPLPANFSGSSMVVDFSSVSGPEQSQGFWSAEEHAVQWGNGERWSMLPSSTAEHVLRF